MTLKEVLDEKIEKAYLSQIQGTIKKAKGKNISNYLGKIYREKFPSSLKNYFIPEKKYLDILSKEIEPYMEDLVSETEEKLSDWSKIEKMTLGEIKRSLLTFKKEEKQEEFCNKLNETIEEISYASKVALAEFYKIYEVKKSLPVIGKFWKSEIKNKLGNENLPEFGEATKLIEKYKQELKEIFLDYSQNTRIKELDENQIFHRYNTRMETISQDRRLLSYDCREGIFQSKLKKKNKLENLSQKEVWEKDKFYRGSPYNGFFERFISYVGSIFKFILHKQ